MGAREEAGRWELARSNRAAGQARALVDGHRGPLGEEPWRRARLLASELATNAVRHGHGRIELLITDTGSGLRVTVRDEGGERRLTPRRPGEDGGFGLHLLADLADRWGEERPGTIVWFEVDA